MNEGVDDGSMLGQIEGGEFLDMADDGLLLARCSSRICYCSSLAIFQYLISASSAALFREIMYFLAEIDDDA